MDAQPKLVIREKDLPGELNGRLKADSQGTRVLGGTDTAQAVFDAIPGVIAKRLEKIVPKDFVLAEVELKLALDFEIPGFKCGGDVVVKLRPAGK
jgi:hypothetical protein